VDRLDDARAEDAAVDLEVRATGGDPGSSVTTSAAVMSWSRHRTVLVERSYNASTCAGRSRPQIRQVPAYRRRRSFPLATAFSPSTPGR
jgi:hypothetical protein